MTERTIYFGPFGPFYYDDEETYDTPEDEDDQGFGDGEAIEGALSDGSMTMASYKLFDTNASNKLSLIWNEDDDTDRTFNLLVGGGSRSVTFNEDFTVIDGQDIELHASGGEKAQLAIDTQNAERTLDLSGNLTVEANSIINQDLSSDSATAQLANLGVGTAVDLDTGIYISKVLTDTDNSGKAAIRAEAQVAKTSAAMTSAGWGVYGQVILNSTNTQNWTHADAGLRAVCGYVGTEVGSTGIVTGAASLCTNADIADAATITNLYGLQVVTPTVDGSKVTNEYGIYVEDQNTGATLNYAIYTNAGLVRFGDDVTLADGASLSLQEDITFTGATTENQIKIPDNLADAFSILQAGNKYVTFITTDDLEDIVFYKSVDILHTAVGAGEHALEIDADAANHGDVKAIDIDYITGTIALGQNEGIILINIDQSSAAGGDIFALEVLATESANPTGVYGLKAGALVAPVHQDSGTFADMASALVNDVDKLTAFITSDPGGDPGTNNVEMFSSNGHTVIIGNATKFEELEFLLETVASGGGIKPTFEFSTGEGAWTPFTPVDGTDGMRHSGIIAWEDADIPTWAVDNTPEYLIRITRTRQTLTTPPKEDKVQIAAVTEYVWDENGDLSVRGATFTGTVIVPSTNFTIGSTTFSETQLSEVVTFFGSTDISAAEAETLTDTSDADALHSHGTLVAAHAMLDGSVHSDSIADAVTRGSIIYGNTTPNWDELVIGTGFLRGDGTDCAWLSYANSLAALSGAAAAAFSFNSQNLTALGTLATAAGTLTIDQTASLSAKANLAGPTFSGTVTVPSTNFTVGTQVLTQTNLTDLLDGGDTTLHDHAASHAAVTLNASATTGGLSLSTQEIAFRAATNAQTGYATAAHITAIETNTNKATCNFTNVQTALGAAIGPVDFNSQNLTSVGTIACATISCSNDVLLTNGNYVGILEAERLRFYTAGYAAFLACDVGIGMVSPATTLDIAKGDGQAIIRLSTYDTGTPTRRSKLEFRRSETDTIGTLVTTIDGCALGTILWHGVDNGNNSDLGADIRVTQNGAVGINVPADMELATYSSTGRNEDQLVLHHDGHVDIGTHNGATTGLKLGGTLVTKSAAQVNRLTQIATGSYTGDGTTSKAITGAGFLPRHVKIWRAAADLAAFSIVETTTQMMARDAQGLAAYSSGGVTNMWDNAILTLDADGFTISDGNGNLDPNKDGVDYDWIALG